MELDEYQRRAQEFDISERKEGELPVVPLLGLAGEVGELLTQYKQEYRAAVTKPRTVRADESSPKKKKRRSRVRPPSTQRIKEELGDILWYLSTVASRSQLTLSEIAESSLRKSEDLFGEPSESAQPLFAFAENGFFDDDFPTHERLPRKRTTFRLADDGGTVRLFMGNHRFSLGDRVTDNVWTPDGYRYHDVFHLTYATILRWSPVMRDVLGCKRRRPREVDEIEDGGRAIVVEETASLIAFMHAKDRGFFRERSDVDYEVLRLIKRLTDPYEVSRCTVGDWRHAILEGFKVWNEVVRHRGGQIICDAKRQKITFKPLVKRK